ncbi:MAG: hypothetical protein IJX81_05880 [Clostridia bacterium]|nr:hypothetical protein [Clostridia bacterium]
MNFLRILKALLAYGVDVLLLGFLEKLLRVLVEKLTACLTTVSRIKDERAKSREEKVAP